MHIGALLDAGDEPAGSSFGVRKITITVSAKVSFSCFRGMIFHEIFIFMKKIELNRKNDFPPKRVKNVHMSRKLVVSRFADLFQGFS